MKGFFKKIGKFASRPREKGFGFFRRKKSNAPAANTKSSGIFASIRKRLATKKPQVKKKGPGLFSKLTSKLLKKKASKETTAAKPAGPSMFAKLASRLLKRKPKSQAATPKKPSLFSKFTGRLFKKGQVSAKTKQGLAPVEPAKKKSGFFSFLSSNKGPSKPKRFFSAIARKLSKNKKANTAVPRPKVPMNSKPKRFFSAISSRLFGKKKPAAVAENGFFVKIKKRFGTKPKVVGSTAPAATATATGAKPATPPTATKPALTPTGAKPALTPTATKPALTPTGAKPATTPPTGAKPATTPPVAAAALAATAAAASPLGKLASLFGKSSSKKSAVPKSSGKSKLSKIMDPFKKVARDASKGFSKTFSSANLSKFAARTAGMRKVLAALIFIAVIVAIVIVAIYFVRVRYPRPMYLNAPKDVGDILMDIYVQMNNFHNLARKVDAFAPVKVPNTLAFIESTIQVQPIDSRQKLEIKGFVLGPCGPRQQDSFLKFSSDPVAQVAPPKMPQHKESPFEVYLKHENIFQGWDQYIYSSLLKHYRQYSECGSDNIAGELAVGKLINDVRSVQAELINAIETVRMFEVDGIGDGPNSELLVEYCIGVHMMYFYLFECTKNLKEMFDIRRFSLFNFLKVLIDPMVKNILENEIKARWIDITLKSTIDGKRAEFENGWNVLGTRIKNAPSDLVNIIDQM